MRYFRAVTWALLATTLLVPSLLGAGTRSTTRARRARTVRAPALPAVILPPEPSQHDLAVGDAARRALHGIAGSVVALDPMSGRVIALVNPQYGLFKAYQPCSVFKIVVAIAGLTEGVITPESTYNCIKGCWTWPGHGVLNLRRALAVSCNPYFEWVGEQLGYEKIQKYANLLGLGSVSGINLTGEASGHLPAERPPGARRPPVEPRGRDHHLGRTARRAPLRHGQRRRNLPTPGGPGRRTSCPRSDGGSPRERW